MEAYKQNPETQGRPNGEQDGPNIEGYPEYATGEDIYSMSALLANVDPEDVTQNKSLDSEATLDGNNEKDSDEDESGDDLDVPGPDENGSSDIPGEEDEENSYYSLGGDEHNDLDEDKSD